MPENRVRKRMWSQGMRRSICSQLRSLCPPGGLDPWYAPLSAFSARVVLWFMSALFWNDPGETLHLPLLHLKVSKRRCSFTLIIKMVVLLILDYKKLGRLWAWAASQKSNTWKGNTFKVKSVVCESKNTTHFIKPNCPSEYFRLHS